MLYHVLFMYTLKCTNFCKSLFKRKTSLAYLNVACFNCQMPDFHICRTNSTVFSFSSSPKLARMTQPRQPFLQAPTILLGSFNYLMQDAGIMLGHHLKEADAFIYWDASCVRSEVCLSAMKPADVLFKATFICLFLPLSLVLFFFLSVSLQCALQNHIFVVVWRPQGHLKWHLEEKPQQ